MTSSVQFTDQLSRKVRLRTPPLRIVSLVPSQTELLAYLGLDKEVVGITKFCVHPETWYRSKTRIGGTKNVKVDRVLQLDPDLIIANKEENSPETIAELEEHCPVWISDIQTIGDNYEMIAELGKVLKRSDQATKLIDEIKLSLDAISSSQRKFRALYLIWKDPYMVAGRSTFIHEMMRLAGFENVASDVSDDDRYPILTLEQMEKAAPEIILLSSEPYPFKEEHIGTLQKRFTKSKILLVDGELFSWYGPRLIDSGPYFEKLRNMLV